MAPSLLLQARIHVDIADIDDGCLLNIFKQLTPLPDLFQVAATCKVVQRMPYALRSLAEQRFAGHTSHGDCRCSAAL